MIGIVDYGAGNLKSVFHAFDAVGVEAELCSHPSALGEYEKLVLPGVGAFGWCYKNLAEGDWIEPLSKRVLQEKVPILGICVGMQLMAESSQEGGMHPGLGWIKGEVVAFDGAATGVKVPHIGWNSVSFSREHAVVAGIPNESDVYFVHSYHFRCADRADVLASCEYGLSFAAAVARENIVGIQFHPEKSQERGIQIIRNFSHWKPQC